MARFGDDLVPPGPKLSLAVCDSYVVRARGGSVGGSGDEDDAIARANGDSCRDLVAACGAHIPAGPLLGAGGGGVGDGGGVVIGRFRWRRCRRLWRNPVALRLWSSSR